MAFSTVMPARKLAAMRDNASGKLRSNCFALLFAIIVKIEKATRLNAKKVSKGAITIIKTEALRTNAIKAAIADVNKL
jgi:hypothetical protein